jgi:hypothetical protein
MKFKTAKKNQRYSVKRGRDKACPTFFCHWKLEDRKGSCMSLKKIISSPVAKNRKVATRKVTEKRHMNKSKIYSPE